MGEQENVSIQQNSLKTGGIAKKLGATNKAKKGYIIMEFRDIKEYMRTPSGATYEDKATFYPERYNATKSSVAALIRRFNNDNGFDLQKFLGPQHGLDRKLNNLINYAVSNGMKSSDAEAVFEKVSTVHYKVDVATEAEVKPREKDYKDYSHRFFVP